MSESTPTGPGLHHPGTYAAWQDMPQQHRDQLLETAKLLAAHPGAVAANGQIIANLIALFATYGPSIIAIIKQLIPLFTTAALVLLLCLPARGAALAATHTDSAGNIHKVGGIQPLSQKTKLRLRADARPRPQPQPAPVTPKPIDFRNQVPEILDQDGYNACAGCAGTEGHRLAEIIAGNPDPKDSVADLYDRVNGGTDDGADLSACVTAMQHGVAPTNLVPQWEIPLESEVTGIAAARLANPLEENTYLSSEQEVLGAIESGSPVYVGINVTSKFEPDKTGHIGKYAGRVEGGHAVLLVGVIPRPTAGYDYVLQNSWGKNWGQAGYATIDPSWIDPEIYGAFALTGKLRTNLPVHAADHSLTLVECDCPNGQCVRSITPIVPNAPTPMASRESRINVQRRTPLRTLLSRWRQRRGR